MKRVLISLFFLQALTALWAQKPLSLVNTFYATLNNYVLQNDHIEYQKLMNMCDAGFRVSDRFAQEQSDIPSPSLLLQSYLELLRDKQVKLAITDMREITLSNHRTEGAPTKTVLVNLSLSSPKISTYKLQNVVYIRNNKIFCVGDYEVDKSGKVLADVVNKTSRTSTNNNIHNGHEYVDLGLSVMWATCNVGAESPEDYGDYFAWGELHPKRNYTYENYMYIKDNSTTRKSSMITKYNTSSDEGIVDDKTQLELSDDAASYNWGGSWRLPTQLEIEELHDQCIWTWTIKNGVNGYTVKSKRNSNNIFLPAAGECFETIRKAGTNGFYWSSLLDDVYNRKAQCLSFVENTVHCYGHGNRYLGHSVRPVYSLH